MDYKEIYSYYLSLIEKRIAEYVPQLEPERLYEPFRYIMKEGGKRLRPILTVISAGIVGGNPEKAIDCGVAIEILHNFTLVHDDIMDNSPLRRGRQTIHEKWDSATAILTGDVMIGYAYRLLPNSAEHQRADAIRAIFTNELIEVCEGQVLDMMFNQKKEVDKSEYFQMIDKKTARLIESSALIGAHIGLGSDNEINALKHIARYIGLAFQIQDDLLDMTANQNNFGKKLGKDIVEGKKTFLIITAQQKAESMTDKKLLEEFIDNNGLPENKIMDMDDLFKRNGVYDIAQKEIDFLFDSAKKSFNVLKKNQYTEMLLRMLESMNKRVI
ncbi:MAG: polyprenyl synthetase family protein [Candidatus Kapaibacterium sp.]